MSARRKAIRVKDFKKIIIVIGRSGRHESCQISLLKCQRCTISFRHKLLVDNTRVSIKVKTHGTIDKNRDWSLKAEALKRFLMSEMIVRTFLDCKMHSNNPSLTPSRPPPASPTHLHHPLPPSGARTPRAPP